MSKVEINRERINERALLENIEKVKREIKKASEEGKTKETVFFNKNFVGEIKDWLDKRNFDYNETEKYYTNEDQNVLLVSWG